MTGSQDLGQPYGTAHLCEGRGAVETVVTVHVIVVTEVVVMTAVVVTTGSEGCLDQSSVFQST